MYNSSVPSLHIIYASTSGHTEYVIGVVTALLHEKGITDIEVQKAEQVVVEDFARGDVLLLASGTWNTGGIEGQLNPHMHELLLKRSKEADLGGRSVAIVALGDERYYYTARAGEHLRTFVQSHNGITLGTPLAVVNEPYGQEDRIRRWTEKELLPALA